MVIAANATLNEWMNYLFSVQWKIRQVAQLPRARQCVYQKTYTGDLSEHSLAVKL